MKRIIFAFVILFANFSHTKTSICYGTTKNGSLKYGVDLPRTGNNFVTYSTGAKLAGRTYVHSTVKDIVIDSYKYLETEQPKKVFKYAETGFKGGGKFRPHKTHQNGLSVDFMTPVTNPKNKSVHLPTNVTNRFGYDIEFSKKGQYKHYSIDYEAMAAHIVALHKQAIRRDVDIWRVLFDPKLQPKLFKTKYAKYLRKHIRFSKKRSWVRHDEHYHVDFKVPCRPMKK